MLVFSRHVDIYIHAMQLVYGALVYRKNIHQCWWLWHLSRKKKKIVMFWYVAFPWRTLVFQYKSMLRFLFCFQSKWTVFN